MSVITREQLVASLAAFRAQREQAQATFNAANGAIQFCEHLIAQLGAPAPSDIADAAVVNVE